MISDSEIDKLIAKQGVLKDAQVMAQAVVRRLKCCPFCENLFITRDDLRLHVKTNHPDKLKDVRSKDVTEHKVKRSAEKIYMCPHCHFAVSTSELLEGTTTITSHVKSCPQNQTVSFRVSFSSSDDAELIASYVRGDAKIKFIACPGHECMFMAGSQDALLDHLKMEHSTANWKKLPEEIRHRIVTKAERAINEKASKKDPPVLPTEDGPACCPEISPHIELDREFTHSVKGAEIELGFVVPPTALRKRFGTEKSISVEMAPLTTVADLPFEPSNGHLSELRDWYRRTGIEPGDKILFAVLSTAPLKIRLWTNWEKKLDEILKSPPDNLEWQSFSIRDCLLIAMRDRETPIHYRSLYAEISRHRELAVGSVVAALSKHRGVLFQHRGRGEWLRLKENRRTEKGTPPSRMHAPLKHHEEPDDRDWQIVREIEEEDLVFDLLRRTREDLLSDQICQKIAEFYGIDWHRLQRLGIIDVHDRRLKRLDNGRFALGVWFEGGERLPEGDYPGADPKPTNGASCADNAGDIMDVLDGREGRMRTRWGLVLGPFSPKKIVARFSALLQRVLEALKM